MSFYSAIFANRIPYKSFVENGEVFCHWLNTGDKKFAEPFFDETILKCRAMPENAKMAKCVSALSMLPEWTAGMDAVKPTAFIFHLSRCGSTLVSQLLTLDPKNIVLPEVPFFDELLRLQYQLPALPVPVADEWLEAAIQLYGQKRNTAEQHLFIKTDCWHIFFYERLRKLYPDIPFILLYRSPDEVLRSQQKKRGMQAVPDIIEPEIMGIRKEDIRYHDFDHYFSLVMEKILERFLQVAAIDPLAVPVNYNEGIISIVKKIAAHANIEINDDLLQQMEDRSRYHAKFPEQAFTGDGLPGSMPDHLTNSMNLYQQLEEKRTLTASAS